MEFERDVVKQPDKSKWCDQQLLEWMWRHDHDSTDATAERSGGTAPAELLAVIQALDKAAAEDFISARPFCPTGSTRALLLDSTANASSLPLWPKRFELIRQIGRGGFGIVFLARDRQLDREVAIKIPRPDLLLTKDSVLRLMREAKHAATLHHDNIVPVFGIEASFPIPALVYHYCRGPTLAEWRADTESPIGHRTATQIVSLLAEAVQHAHSRGILHRDLKPSNVLLDAGDQKTQTRGIRDGEHYWIPRIIDFGISKALDQQRDLTGTGVVLGTPAYMSPEQASGNIDEVGTHSDIYSLGAILYELLAGRAPFEGKSPAQVLSLIQIRDPDPIRQHRADVPRELEAIALKCLRKEPPERYSSAAALGEDLRNYLEGRPVNARPANFVASGWRWARRQPALATLFLVCLIVVMGSAIGAAVHFHRIANLAGRLEKTNRELDVAASMARFESQRARQNAEEYRSLLYASDVALAYRALKERDLRTVDSLLRKQIPERGQQDLRDLAWWHLNGMATRESKIIARFEGPAYCVRFSPDGKYLAASSADGTVQLFSTRDELLMGTIKTGQGEVNGVSFSHCGTRVATAGDDGSIRVWDRMTLAEIHRIDAHENLAYDVMYVPGDHMLVSCGNDSIIRLWNAMTGDLAGTLVGHERAVESIAVSRDGRRLVSASSDMTCRVWDILSGKEIGRKECGERANSVCFNADESRFYAGILDGHALAFDPAPGSGHIQTDRFGEGYSGICDIDYSNRGECLVVASRDGTIVVNHLWQITSTANPLYESSQGDRWQAHHGRAYSVAISPDSKLLYSVGEDGLLKRWTLNSASEARVFDVAHTHGVSGEHLEAVLGKSQQVVVVHKGNGRVSIWSPAHSTFREWAQFGKEPTFLHIADNDSSMAVGYHDGRLELWAIDAEQPRLKWSVATQGTGRVQSIDISTPAGRVFAANGESQLVQQFAVYDGRELASFKPPADLADSSYHVAVNDRFVAAGGNRHALLWAVEGRPLKVLTGHMSGVKALAFDPAGSLLATGSVDRTIRLWNTHSGEQVHLLEGHRASVERMFFTPDGRNLISGSTDGVVKMWHVATGKELYDLLKMPAGGRIVGLHNHSLIAVPEPNKLLTLPLSKSQAMDTRVEMTAFQ